MTYTTTFLKLYVQNVVGNRKSTVSFQNNFKYIIWMEIDIVILQGPSKHFGLCMRRKHAHTIFVYFWVCIKCVC